MLLKFLQYVLLSAKENHGSFVELEDIYWFWPPNMQLQNHFKLPFYMLFLLPMRHMSGTYKCSLIGLSKKLLHGERVIHTKKCLLPCPNKFYNYLGVSATLVWKGLPTNYTEIVMFAPISKYISYIYRYTTER